MPTADSWQLAVRHLLEAVCRKPCSPRGCMRKSAQVVDGKGVGNLHCVQRVRKWTKRQGLDVGRIYGTLWDVDFADRRTAGGQQGQAARGLALVLDKTLAVLGGKNIRANITPSDQCDGERLHGSPLGRAERASELSELSGKAVPNVDDVHEALASEIRAFSLVSHLEPGQKLLYLVPVQRSVPILFLRYSLATPSCFGSVRWCVTIHTALNI
jgi:hypothetical protein